MRFGEFTRYVFYLVTSLKLRSFRGWTRDGQPNPFVKSNRPRVRNTSQQELLDIFEDHGVGWKERKPRRVVVRELKQPSLRKTSRAM